jgi:hypothetical protein
VANHVIGREFVEQKGISYSKPDAWTVDELMDALHDNPIQKKRVVLPRYQRNLVWSDGQCKKFIDSLKKGYPFGSLLLYNIGPHDNSEHYSLIDGLQRVSTLSKHEKCRTKFFDETDVPVELISDLAFAFQMTEAEQTQVSHLIGEWVRSLTDFEETAGYSAYKLAKFICHELSRELTPDVLDGIHDGILAPFLKQAKAQHDISGLKIPLMIYNGEQHDLPEIFARLNRQGTQLSKYQIYAATWSHEQMRIPNQGVTDMIKEKYDSIMKQGMTVEGYDPDSKTWRTQSFSPFEYLFGLGKWLAKQNPGLFGSASPENPDITDSVAFNLCTTCLGFDISAMADVAKKLQVLDTKRFEEELVSSISLVTSALLPVTRLRLNTKDSGVGDSPNYYHTEFQIVSMIGRCFRAKYLPSLSVRPGWEATWEKLRENLRYHYLYDVVRHSWAGTGDKQVDELVKDDSRYEAPISREAWSRVLDTWCDEELAKKERNRNVRNEDLLFLRFVYAHLVSAFIDALPDHPFHVEHLVPVARLRKMLGKDGGLPMNAVANLALIPEKLNLKKGDQTLFEYCDGQVHSGKMTREEALRLENEVGSFLIVSRPELSDAVVSDEKTYESFLKGRFAVLKERFLNLNSVKGEDG